MDSSVPFSMWRPFAMYVSVRTQCADRSGVSTVDFFLLPMRVLYLPFPSKSIQHITHILEYMASTPPYSTVSVPSRDVSNAFRTDMFGRTKVSEAFTIFDSVHRYQDNGDFSDTTANGATVTYDALESTVLLNTTTASGSEVTRESRKVFPYQSGKSLQVMDTFVLAPSQTNLRQRVGHFTRDNGFFLEYTDEGLFFVRRSSSTGSVVDLRVHQSEWNGDKLDGMGGTDVVLDPSKAQIIFTELQWFGVGACRMGFVIDGFFVIAHQFNHVNYFDASYMTAGSKPIRHEITNIGPTESASSFKQIASSVIMNGGALTGTDVWNATRTETAVGEDYFPLISMRMKEGRTDAIVIPEMLNLFPTSGDDFDWALVKNATITDGAWVTAAKKGNVEYNITSETMVGGDFLIEGFFGGTNQNAVPINYGEITNFNLQMGRTNAVPAVSDVFTLAVKVVGASSGTVKAAFNWFDLT